MKSELSETKHSAAWTARLPQMNPVRAFAAVFMGVFLFIFLGAALVTYLMPETYKARARVRAPGSQGVEVFQSAEVLREVAQKLRLPETYAAQYGEREPLDERRMENLLLRSVRVRRVRGSDVVEVQAYSRSPADCAQLANAIAKVGVEKSNGTARMIEQALPPEKASRPNKPLNLALGALVGIFLGTMAGGVGAKLAVGFDGRDQ